MVALVPAKQWHTCVPAATHLFSPPALRLCPSIRTRPPVLHRTLSPSPTNAAPLFPFFSPLLSLPTPIGQGWHFFFFFLSGQRKWQQWLRKRRDSWTVMDWDRVAFAHLSHPLFVVCVLISFFQCLFTLPCLLTLLPSSTSSCVLGFFSRFLLPPLSLNSVCRSFNFSYHISHCFYLSLSPLFLLFVSVCSRSTMRSEPLQWIISQLTHRGQPNPPVQTWDNIQMIGWLALERGNKPPYQLEPGSVHRSAHKAY